MKKHRLTAAACAAVVVGALAGCSTDVSSGGGDASAATSLVASAGAPEQTVIDMITADDPELTVDVQTAPGTTYAQVVATQLAGGTAADIVRAYPGDGSSLSIVQGANNGFFAPLDDLDFVSGLSDADASVLRDDDGNIVAVPVTTSAIGGVYNQTEMDAAGLSIPTTWSDLLDFCGDARDADVVPFGLGLKDAWTSQFVSYALGATLLPADIADVQASNDAPFSDTQWRDVIEKYAEMREADCFTDQPNGTTAANVSSQLATGEALATISLTTTVGSVAAEAPSDTELTFAPIPASDDEDATKLSTGIGVVFALNAKAKNPDAAKKVLEYFATPEAQSTYAAEADMSPALEVGADYAPDQPTEVIQEFTAGESTAPWPDQSWPNPNIQQAHFTQIQSLFSGSASVDDVLAALDKAYTG